MQRAAIVGGRLRSPVRLCIFSHTHITRQPLTIHLCCIYWWTQTPLISLQNAERGESSRQPPRCQPAGQGAPMSLCFITRSPVGQPTPDTAPASHVCDVTPAQACPRISWSTIPESQEPCLRCRLRGATFSAAGESVGGAAWRGDGGATCSSARLSEPVSLVLAQCDMPVTWRISEKNDRSEPVSPFTS